jgi:uncharacterized protein (TIGR03066 family)
MFGRIGWSIQFQVRPRRAVMRVLLIATLAALFCYPLLADDKKDEKIDAAKIVGKWKPKDEKEQTTIEFSKDGTVTFTFKVKDKDMKVSQKYKVEGDKLILTEKVNGKEVTIKASITKLTDTELVTKDEKEGSKEDTLIRIKDK